MAQFLELEDNKTVSFLLFNIVACFRNRDLGGVSHIKFSEGLERIAKTLLIQPHKKSFSVNNTAISVSIHPDLYNHISQYLNKEEYFSAVQESYKFVREKFKSIVEEESASAIFGENALRNDYQHALFGSTPEKGTPKYDFYKGYAYLHLAIQFLRNEQAHSLSKEIDRNLACHFITLTSLAYTLITDKNT